MSDTPRTDALARAAGTFFFSDPVIPAIHARQFERYAVALRGLVVEAILRFSEAGFQGNADKLEDAMDKTDAIIGEGPYA